MLDNWKSNQIHLVTFKYLVGFPPIYLFIDPINWAQSWVGLFLITPIHIFYERDLLISFTVLKLIIASVRHDKLRFYFT